ncbi:glycosyltransferase [Secundilactobacillus mixtipabuli]|uniref:Glycosyl transferase n=1 Tax=Secundilactobacillus mixtipabuli TaxID=1435342 RepID=A0A1Z5IF70_9LACO|nr:glycosyltransferase [Secundilactobacillus mixtipabuli]GAX00081.1 glycosyl transferase [Secundilactobacillus mixtipabuli]
MEKQISIIIPVNNAQESDLAVPLSSINNQIGVDLAQIEVILVDNGTYKLKQPKLLELFANIEMTYLKTNQALDWVAALQFGLGQATGTYVMFMGVNGQLNQTDILQTFLRQMKAHAGADVISPLLLEQAFSPDLQFDYKVGQNTRTVRGRLFRRGFLSEQQINFPVGVPEHAEEYFCNLVHLFANEDVAVNEIGYTKFTNRHLPAGVLAGFKRPVDPQWLTMKEQYFEKLKNLNQQTYANEFARFVVRFYSQIKQLPETAKGTMQQLMQSLVGKNALTWGYVLGFIGDLKRQDQSPKAPWNAETAQFNQYLEGFTVYLKQLGFSFNVAQN